MFVTLSRKFCALISNRKSLRTEILKEATAPMFEILEDRRLLSTVTFTVASTSVNSSAASVYLTQGSNPK